MERNALLQLCNNWLCNSSCATIFIPKPSSPQMHLVCRFQEHAPAPPKGAERRNHLKVLSILHCPSTLSPSPCALKESNTSPGANPMLVNWDHLPIPAHSSYRFLFQNERVLRRPSGNETKMHFISIFFSIHHFCSSCWVPRHPAWHNPELVPSHSEATASGFPGRKFTGRAMGGV